MLFEALSKRPFQSDEQIFSSGILVSNILGLPYRCRLAYISDNNNLDDNTKIAITTGFLQFDHILSVLC